MLIGYYLGCDVVNTQGVWTGQNQGYNLPTMTLADRINERTRALEETQESIAKKSGVSQTTIYKLTSGKTQQTRKLVAVARALGVSPEWLETGDGPMETTPLYSSLQASASLVGKLGNTAPAPEVVGWIPLISWVQAGRWCGVVDLFDPGDAEAWLPTLKRYSRHAFALRVVGDSMVSPYPGQRSYPPGTILYVDPDCTVENGSRVIAKLPDENEATFKCYREDGGKRYLVPLNPQYPTVEITREVELCGVVVAKYEEE